jgi:hypothetical protein
MKRTLSVAANLLFAVCTALASCRVSTTMLAPKVVVVDEPPIGVEHVAEIGDTIVRKGVISTFATAQLSNELTAGDGFVVKKFTIRPQRLTATRESREYTFYLADNNIDEYEVLLGANAVVGGLAISKSPPASYRIFAYDGAVMFKPKQEPQLVFGETYARSAPSFQQELIYNGRVGDSVKFLYRELGDNMLRSAFSQEVQYDLTDGNEIGFKGARIQIVDATNLNLKYRVIQSFPEDGALAN